MVAWPDRRGAGLGGGREGRERGATRDHGRAPGAEVRLSSAARADLVEIREYSIAQFDPETANAYFLGFDEAFDLLSTHPNIGMARPDLGKDIRCLTHRKHRLFYCVEKLVVIIIRVVHHARVARTALGEAE